MQEQMGKVIREMENLRKKSKGNARNKKKTLTSEYALNELIDNLDVAEGRLREHEDSPIETFQN